MKVYIAGPYNADTLEQIETNVDRVLRYAVVLSQHGYSVFVPHLTHYIDQKAKEMGIELPNDKWVELDLPWLEVCDAMLVTGKSKGVRSEVEFAAEHGIPICYSLEDLKNLDKTSDDC